MRVVYTHEKISDDGVSCFLAGPTPVSSDVKSWRNDAIKYFEKHNFKFAFSKTELVNPKEPPIINVILLDSIEIS